MFEDEQFSKSLSERVVHAKINNQMVVLKRYLYARKKSTDYNLFPMRNARRRVIETNGDNWKYQIKGYEGIAAKTYFEIMSNLLPKDCPFKEEIGLQKTRLMHC